MTDSHRTISAQELDALETKLTAARTRLILDKPFLGALVLRLPLRVADPAWCPTVATDARAFFYNPDYIAELTPGQTQFMLAHEALHCALSHFARRQHRERQRWDLACDHAINPLLIDEGLEPPPDALYLPLFKGMTAEEIYPLIEIREQDQTLDRHVYDDAQESDQGGGRGLTERDLSQSSRGRDGQGEAQGTGEIDQSARQGSAKPSSLTPDQRETLAIQWRQRLAGAAQQALQAGKLGGELARLVDSLLQPQLPWRMLLARYLSSIARDDYSYRRLSRREGEFILPSLHSQQIDLVVALDTSGSIKDDELDAFIAEVDALKGQIRARVTLLPCDAELCEGAPFVFEPWETFERPERIAGGGGTRFDPVFDWIERQGMTPDLLLYFTDAQASFPAHEPAFPVLWLVKGRASTPWGERIQLN